MTKEKEPECNNCLDIPLFGCVACPLPPSIWDLKRLIKKKIKDIKETTWTSYDNDAVIEILEGLIE